MRVLDMPTNPCLAIPLRSLSFRRLYHSRYMLDDDIVNLAMGLLQLENLQSHHEQHWLFVHTFIVPKVLEG